MDNPAPKDQDPNEPQLRDHVYDGIQEYDQKLPNWWLFTWYITMVWFVIAWLAYYQLGYGKNDSEAIEGQLARIEAIRQKDLEGIDDAKLWELSRDPAVVEKGKATFLATCVACHGPDLSAMMAGAKLPGLPLNDQEWKHGGNPLNVMSIVRKGAPDVTKGMTAWEPVLGLDRVIEVVAFVMSHHKEGEPVTLAPDSPLKEENAGPAAAGGS